MVKGLMGAGMSMKGPTVPARIKERLLGVAFQERLIRRRQSVALVRPPPTIRPVTNRERSIQVRQPGLGIAVGVINGGELYLELCDARVLKRISNLGQIRHRGGVFNCLCIRHFVERIDA